MNSATTTDGVTTLKASTRRMNFVAILLVGMMQSAQRHSKLPLRPRRRSVLVPVLVVVVLLLPAMGRMKERVTSSQRRSHHCS
jgi:hypothetical protein